MKRKLITLGIIFISLIILLFGCYKLMNSRVYQVAGNLISNVETEDKVVYLTFDDGPIKETQKILDVLNELDVKATLFLIGSKIEENME